MGVSAFNKSLFNSAAFIPVVQANFAADLGDYSTLSTLSSMPSGGSISRSGQGMLYDSTGKLTYAPNNLVLQSQALNTGWDKVVGGVGTTPVVTNNFATAPDGSMTATRAVLALNGGTTSTDRSYLQRFVTIASGTNYVFSFYAKLNVGTSATLMGFFGAGATVIILPTVTNSWQRFSFNVTATTSSTSVRIGLMGGQSPATADSVDVLLWGVQIEAVTYQTTPSTYVATTTAAYYGPRFDYNPSTLAAKGLLIEGTRTNLNTYSQLIGGTNWNSSLTGSITTNSATSPDGTTTASTLTKGAVAYQAVYQSVGTIASGTIYTFSAYVKANTVSAASLAFLGTTTFARYSFTLTGSGSVGSALGTQVNYISSAIQSVGNGWYRISITVAGDGTAGSVYIYPDVASNAVANSIYAWGAQTEAASFASSYIPTVASTVARAAETFAITGYSSNLINAYYIDEATGGSYSLPYNAGTAPSPSFSWLTSLRAYTNAYAGSIASPSWLSFSRSGNAMMTDSTGELTFAPNNLLLNTATLSTQTVTTGIIPSCNVILSFKGTGSVAISGGHTATLAGTGTSNLVSLKFTTTTASLTFTVTGTVTEAQLERVTYETSPSAYIPTTTAAVYGPRYDFDPSTVPATPRGLLIEEARTNVLTYSEQLNDAAWEKTRASITANATIAPDGTISADKLVEDTTASNTHFIRNIIENGNATYTFSVYIKPAERSFAFVGMTDGVTALVGAEVNLSTGALSNSSSGSWTGLTTSSTSVGNGWLRVVITATRGAGTSTGCSVRIGQSISSFTYTGDGTSGIYVWGAQLEAGSFATSYIPTTTASVTRAPDVSFSTSISSWYSTAASTAIVQYNIPYAYPTASFPILSSFSDATTNNTNRLFLIGSILNAAFQNSLVGSVNIGRINATPTFTAGQPMRAAMAYKINDRAVTANGTTPTTAATSPYLGSTTRLSIGTDEVGTSQINGWIQSFAYYNRRLPNEVLKAKSTVGATY